LRIIASVSASAFGPAIETAVVFLQANLHSGDLVVAPRPFSLNCFRCYVDNAGVEDLDLRTLHSLFAHDLLMSHAYALTADDVMGPEYVSRPSVRRIWVLIDGGPAPASPAPGMEKVLERSFDAKGDSPYSLSLFARKE